MFWHFSSKRPLVSHRSREQKARIMICSDCLVCLSGPGDALTVHFFQPVSFSEYLVFFMTMLTVAASGQKKVFYYAVTVGLLLRCHYFVISVRII